VRSTSTDHLIVKTPGVCGGNPCIRGTRLEPIRIWNAFLRGSSIEELQTYFAIRELTTEEVEAALRFCMRRRRIP